MAQAIQLTLSEEETRQVLYAVRSSITLMGQDIRHDEDKRALQRVQIQLEAQMKIARLR